VSEQQDHRGIGDNNPPPDDPVLNVDVTKLVVEPELLTRALKLNCQPLLDRADELIAGIDGWVTDHTPPHKPGTPAPKPAVGDEQDLKDTADTVRQIKLFLDKEVDATRKKVKEPLNKAAATIQQFFARDLADVVEKALRPVVEALSLALQAKEKRERQRLIEEAAHAAQLAASLAAQASRATGYLERESLAEQATRIEIEADNLERASQASAAVLSRTRTDNEVVAGLRSYWKFEVVNLIEVLQAIIAGQLPIEWVKLDEVYANSQIRGNDGVRKVPGLHITEEKR
jgi:hypothetical protein